MSTLLKIAKAAKNALIIHSKMLRERCVKCGNELKVLTIAALGFAFLVVANPSAAQQVAACPAAPDFSRYGTTHFTLNFIPHTWDVTTFADLAENQAVNIEIDTLARYLQRMQAVMAG